MTDTNVYICGCARNCENFLNQVFLNIQNISELYTDFVILVAYDISQDNTYDLLSKYQIIYGDKMRIITNPNGVSGIRTENISNARNSILREIRQIHNSNFTCMIMMDFDDVCAVPMNMNVIKQSMDRTDWDTISFNRHTDYYDIWALSLYPYIYSCWHFHPNTRECVDVMKKYITDKLNKMNSDELLECVSAFNGFAIYRLSSFTNCNYDWKLDNNIKLINKLYPNALQHNCVAFGKQMHLGEIYRNGYIGYNADCEHRKFHMSAILLNNARIRISPLCLFL
jgi:hypothetical protein